MPTIAALEAGGTKCVAALANEAGEILATTRVPTTTPAATLARLGVFFDRARAVHGQVVAAGVASFGPLDLDPRSLTYGRITTTPKPGWSGVDVLGLVQSMLGAPAAIDTDVVCAAIAEGAGGAARGLESFAYITVGTGIGVGTVSAGRPLVGHGHAEAGHLRVPRAPADLDFPGVCPFHGDCVEGLASGPAIAARWGRRPEDLPDDHPAWALEAEYVAALCLNLAYTVRPQRLVIGGGVFERVFLHALVRGAFTRLAAGYALGACERSPESFIVPPGSLAGAPGLLGAIELARRLWRSGPPVTASSRVG